MISADYNSTQCTLPLTCLMILRTSGVFGAYGILPRMKGLIWRQKILMLLLRCVSNAMKISLQNLAVNNSHQKE